MNTLSQREELALVPVPETTASYMPVPHVDLLETIENAVITNNPNLTLHSERFQMKGKGTKLFGTMSFVDESASLNDDALSPMIGVVNEIFKKRKVNRETEVSENLKKTSPF